MSHKFSVLVVDDSISIRELIIEELIDLPLNILQAASGSEAFELYKKTERVDFIISDINMPNGNGVDFIRRINQLERAAPPVVLVSGLINLTVEEIEKLGVLKCIENYLDLEGIKKLVASYM